MTAKRNVSAETACALKKRAEEGLYNGRPAAFMFEEDVLSGAFPEGRCNTDPSRGRVTVVLSEKVLYAYASRGYSITRVAEKVLHVSRNALLAEMKLREAEPSIRIDGNGREVRFYRFKGVVDRYSVYMDLYNKAVME